VVLMLVRAEGSSRPDFAREAWTATPATGCYPSGRRPWRRAGESGGV